MNKLNAWIDAGQEFGETARSELGMLCSDVEATIKMAMVINGMTLALPFPDRTATTYSFSDDNFLYVVAHHYNHPRAEDNGLLMACFPIARLADKSGGDILGIIRLATAFLGVEPTDDWTWMTPEEMLYA